MDETTTILAEEERKLYYKHQYKIFYNWYLAEFTPYTKTLL